MVDQAQTLGFWMASSIRTSALEGIVERERKEMKKAMKEVESVDIEEMQGVVESHAMQVENRFIKMFTEMPEEESSRVPLFEFEMN